MQKISDNVATEHENADTLRIKKKERLALKKISEKRDFNNGKAKNVPHPWKCVPALRSAFKSRNESPLVKL